MKRYGQTFYNPAQTWTQAFPLGNGHIGFMVFGDALEERIAVNDDCFWSGYPRDYEKEDFRENLDKVRGYMLENSPDKAQDIIENHMLGRFSQVYLPLGDIRIGYSDWDDEVCEYQRNLDYSKGIASSRCRIGNKLLHTESFCSYPDDVGIYRIDCNEQFSFNVSLVSQVMYQVKNEYDKLFLFATAPSDIVVADVYTFQGNHIINYDEKEKSIRCCCGITIETDGQIISENDEIHVAHCTYATLIFASATSYKYDDYIEHCNHIMDRAKRMGFVQLRENHTKDHTELFNRVELHLNEDSESYLCETGRNIVEQFQFGRYLMIACSREGTQAANLQGIWNDKLVPAWWSNYTLNINLQMNYWAVMRANLFECSEPIYAYLERLFERGKITAARSYKMRGSVAHHQTDIWAQTMPVGFEKDRIENSTSWGMWNMSLPWLCVQLYQESCYCPDSQMLVERLLPLFEGCSEFLEDYLVETKDGLVTIPSISPENSYIWENGKELSASILTAMDLGILKEFFEICITLFENKNPERAGIARRILKGLPDYRIEDGKLLEWGTRREEAEPGHRHFSMLFGLYPGSHLLSEHREDAERTLEHRLKHGGGSTGWSAAWAVALCSRLEKGEEA
ncbi:MAG: glycosyl hydrolase family 95 catalytic domain-containing protein, partial [Oliverpabstia sp.]